MACIQHLAHILPDKTICYQLSFLNFLLAKQPNGPGQFMFGMVETVAPTSFTIDCSLVKEGDTEGLAEEVAEELERRVDTRSRRGSVFV